MTRDQALWQLSSQSFDVLIIGGGASGLGCAVDAASRGLKVALVEASDFCSGTSSKSSKLIHGGVRYLELAAKHLDLKQLHLVRDALTERAILQKIAPHVVQELRLLTPCKNSFGAAYYWCGLQAYDALAGHKSLTPTHFLSRKSIEHYQEYLQTQHIGGMVAYSDAQFDDCALAMSLIQTAEYHGAQLLNYCGVTKLNINTVGFSDIEAIDHIDGTRFTIHARCVINCGGPRSDNVRALSDPNANKRIQCSVGAHIVVSKEHWPQQEALLIPKTEDGRVLFIIPWQDHVVIGTTDEAVAFGDTTYCSHKHQDYLIKHANHYLARPLTKWSVLSSWAGIRPLLMPKKSKQSAKVIRDHRVIIDQSGLINLCGGKWTTYRLMAKDCIDVIVNKYKMKVGPSWTHKLGLLPQPKYTNWQSLCTWAVTHTHAQHIDDILARRSRLAFVDLKAAIDAIPDVADALQDLLHWTSDKRQKEERKAQTQLEREFQARA